MARSSLQQLAYYLQPHQDKVWLGAISLLIVNGMGVFLPWYVKLVIDHLSDPSRPGLSPGLGMVSDQNNPIFFYALVILVISLVMMGIRIFSRVTMFGVGRKVEFDLKQQLFEHLLTLSPSYFGVRTAGDIISRVTSDVENVRRLLGFAILSLINTAFAYCITLPAMFFIDLRLSLLALMVFPVMLVIVKVTSGRLQKQQRGPAKVERSERSDPGGYEWH